MSKTFKIMQGGKPAGTPNITGTPRIFKDRDNAKLYCKSFIQWMYSGVVSATKGTPKSSLTRSLIDLNAAIMYLAKSYEQEIAELKQQLEAQKTKE